MIAPMVPRSAIAAFLALVAQACGAPNSTAADASDVGAVDAPAADPGSPDASTSPWASVGGANEMGEGFVVWTDGKGQPEILKGPQGGQHIWVSARTRNLHPKKARVAVTMHVEGPAGDEMVKPGRVEIIGTLKSEPDFDGLLYAGLPAFVKEPCKIMNKKVRVELEVDDLYGVHAAAKAWISPVWKGYCDPTPP